MNAASRRGARGLGSWLALFCPRRHAGLPSSWSAAAAGGATATIGGGGGKGRRGAVLAAVGASAMAAASLVLGSPAVSAPRIRPSSDPGQESHPADTPSTPLRLLQVHVLFRHGDRSPMPLDTATAEEGAKWERRLQARPGQDVLPLRTHTRGLEYPFGQLTAKGAEQAQSLGSTLQMRYGDALGLWGQPQEQGAAAPERLLSPGLDSPAPHSYLRVRSTNFPRTYQSAFFVLKGLLGSEAAAAKVPIDIRDDKQENLYENEHCSRGVVAWGRMWREHTSPRRGPDGTLHDMGWRGKYQDMKAAMTSFFKLSGDSKFPWVLATDNVACMLAHGESLPPPITPSTVAEIRDHLARDYARVFSVREVARLAMGPLLWELHTTMEECMRSSSSSSTTATAAAAAAAPPPPPPSPSVLSGQGQQQRTKEAAQGPSVAGNLGGGAPVVATLATAVAPAPGPQIFLYSGHDASIMPLAAALGVMPDAWPPYSSWLALELWSTHDRSQHFVRVIYNGREVPLPTTVPPSHPAASWLDPGPWRISPPSLWDQGGNGAPSTSPSWPAGESVTLCPWEHFSRLADWAKMSPQEYLDACKGPHSSL